ISCPVASYRERDARSKIHILCGVDVAYESRSSWNVTDVCHTGSVGCSCSVALAVCPAFVFAFTTVTHGNTGSWFSRKLVGLVSVRTLVKGRRCDFRDAFNSSWAYAFWLYARLSVSSHSACAYDEDLGAWINEQEGIVWLHQRQLYSLDYGN